MINFIFFTSLSPDFINLSKDVTAAEHPVPWEHSVSLVSENVLSLTVICGF